MILTEQQIAKVQTQTGAEAIPQDNTAITALVDRFGSHTFFIDAEGLHVFEPARTANDETEKVVGVLLAAWDNEVRSTLIPKEAPVAGQVVEIYGTDEQSRRS